jgi:hypothetical protein
MNWHPTKDFRKKKIISFKKKRILNEKRGVLFSVFDPIRSIHAEVKMTCSRQPVDSI